MLKNFRFVTSVRPIVHDTYKTAKINFINSGAADIIRTAYYIREAPNALYSVSQKSSPPKFFCDIFTCGELV